MAAVMGILRGHGGTIRVDTRPDAGTTIEILLPASERPARSVSVSRPASEGWRGEGTVLVVDDEHTVRNLAGNVLERAGLRVLLAEDGERAVEVFREHASEIDVVLLDLTMPRKNGEQVFREIREIRPGVPVLLSSGYNEQDVTSKFAGRGLAAFIQKPYRARELLDAVRRALGE